jgi:GcrA cell cycle regulator
MSYSRIADAVNAKFKTTYSRNAAIGRAKRMGLAGPDRPQDWPGPPPKAKAPRLHKLREHYASESRRSMPIFETAEPVKLRCVEIDPRHLSLLDLEPGDCRYPYGGDEEGEAITFCGHPRRQGTSYCVAHFHLGRTPHWNGPPAPSHSGLWRRHEMGTDTDIGNHDLPDEAAGAPPPHRASASADPTGAHPFDATGRTDCTIAR